MAGYRTNDDGQYHPSDPYRMGYQGQGPGQGPGRASYGGYSGGTGYGRAPDQPDAAGYADPPPPPKLHWKELLSGVVFRPDATFWRMRDYAMWGPALVVSFLYGLIAVFGLEDARESILDTTAATVVPYLLVTGTAMVLGSLLLGTVTHNLARQFGGNGLWAPTAGLAMLIMALTDIPRLALALFLGGADPVVQTLGWATWLFACVLFTLMVSRSHELPWPRALAASGIQLLAVLALVKLGTI